VESRRRPSLDLLKGQRGNRGATRLAHGAAAFIRYRAGGSSITRWRMV